MKKIIKILIILLLFNVFGCTKNNTETYEKNEIHNYSQIKNFNCIELNENVKEVSDNYFVDNKGNLYEYSFNKIFSKSKVNCIKIDTSGKYINGISNYSVYDDNDYSYFFEEINEDKNIFKRIKVYEHDKSREYFIKKSFPNSNSQLFLIANFGIILENNKLYEVKFDLDGGYESKNEIKFENSEKILNIYEGFSYEHFFVETDLSYYSCNKIVINKKEYETYADVKCKKEFVCDKINDFINSDVKKFLGKIVIMEDNTIYKYSAINNNDLNYNCDK